MFRFAQLKLAACSAILLASPQAAFGQDSPAPSSDAEMQQAYFDAYNRGDYLGALEALGGDEQGPKSPMAQSPMMQATYQQFRPVLDGFVVETPAIIMNAAGEQIERPAREVPQADLERLAAAEQREAIAAIVERAAGTRIVIINETHDNPRDRIFVMQLAQALAPLGFSHYAAETFANYGSDAQRAQRMEALRLRGHVLLDDGHYTKDPAFAYALSRILAAGYQPVSYEWTPQPEEIALAPEDRIELRESAQARYLAQAIAAQPDAKFLIHVGYSHAAELPFANGQEWMAARLKAATGIDPLTINQTDLSQYSPSGLHAAIAPEMGELPVVLFEDGEPLRIGFNSELMDLQVVHPTIGAAGGRPDWLERTGRTALQLEAGLVPEEGLRLVQVFLPGEEENAVPIDQVLIQPGDAPPVVYVPNDGEYRLAIVEG